MAGVLARVLAIVADLGARLVLMGVSQALVHVAVGGAGEGVGCGGAGGRVVFGGSIGGETRPRRG